MKQKPLLIAEIRINHNGDIKLAKKLIDLAKKTNFDCVKFQKRDIDIVYSKNYWILLEKARGGLPKDQKQGLEFGQEEYDEIDKYCKNIKISWFASAWDLNSLKFLDQYNLNYHKIASAMIVDTNFLKEVAKRKKHTFISTGMSTTENIDNAVKVFREENCSFELMHCISTYPMKPEDANLLTNALKNKYNCSVEYSGHENGIAVSSTAFSMEISSHERHITLDRAMYGSDQSASLEETEMMNLNEMIF